MGPGRSGREQPPGPRRTPVRRALESPTFPTWGYASLMEQDTATLDTTDPTEELVDDELLVEEISIDGMCGVY